MKTAASKGMTDVPQLSGITVVTDSQLPDLSDSPLPVLDAIPHASEAAEGTWRKNAAARRGSLDDGDQSVSLGADSGSSDSDTDSVVSVQSDVGAVAVDSVGSGAVGVQSVALPLESVLVKNVPSGKRLSSFLMR